MFYKATNIWAVLSHIETSYFIHSPIFHGLKGKVFILVNRAENHICILPTGFIIYFKVKDI